MWKCQCCGKKNSEQFCGKCGSKKPEDAAPVKEKGKSSPAMVIAVAIIVAAAMFIAFFGAYLLVLRPFSDEEDIEITTEYESAGTINTETLKESEPEIYEEEEEPVVNKRPSEMLEPELEPDPDEGLVLEPAEGLEADTGLLLEPAEETETTETPVETPMYRVRRSANDAQTQLGAFADFKKAKICAIGNASDGYEVYDMNGKMVFKP